VEEILSKSHTPAAYSTVIAVIDGLVGAILPKFTNVAVVLRRYLTTVDASFRCLLGCSTNHAEHVLCVLADKRVVFMDIMAKTTGIPFFAGRTLQLHVPLIVLTS
jgi:hypothetical protein